MKEISGCDCCEKLNWEKEEIDISEIYIYTAGYYNFHVRIKHCPKCGKLLDKYAKA